MRKVLAILLCCLCLGAFAWPPRQFVNGKFCNGFLALAGTTTNAPSSGPNDGYEANLYAYFNLDSIGSSLVDQVAAANLVLNSGGGWSNPTNAAAFLGSGSVDMMTGANPWEGLAPNDKHYVFTNDVTIRFWIRPQYSGDGYTIFKTRNFTISYGGDTNSIFDGGTSRVNTDVVLQVSAADLYQQTDPISQAWHRIIWWFKAGIESGIQVDTNAAVVTSISDKLWDLNNGNTQLSLEGFFTDHCDVDEIAIWKDYVLTDSDKTFDWNSGAGRTYPLP